MKSRVDREAVFRAIPPVQELLHHPLFALFAISRRHLKSIIQQETHRFRQAVHSGELQPAPETVARLLEDRITLRLRQLTSPQLTRVINATGIIAHTNLGRAPLPSVAMEAIRQLGERYCNLEFQLSSGRRGKRESHVERLFQLLTGAEAALVVNNNAAAVLLVLNSLARRKEVIVSRGELVEIGGSFRLPEVMKSSGARLVEVGTTNKTHLEDYQAAISSRTAAILKVHPSNYRVVGFTSSVPLNALAQLAHRFELPLIYDLGSGALTDLRRWNLPYEPVAAAALAEGADVLTFSGDKVLGGPQAGIVVGKTTFLKKIKRNPLARALRCDKFTYAALEATLRLYLQPEALPQRLPVLHLLTTPVDTLRQRGEMVIQSLTTSSVTLDIVDSQSQMGSGALATETIPSVALCLNPTRNSVSTLARKLRQNQPPIIGYIQNNRLYLDLRTVFPAELPDLIQALNRL